MISSCVHYSESERRILVSNSLFEFYNHYLRSSETTPASSCGYETNVTNASRFLLVYVRLASPIGSLATDQPKTHITLSQYFECDSEGFGKMQAPFSDLPSHSRSLFSSVNVNYVMVQYIGVPHPAVWLYL